MEASRWLIPPDFVAATLAGMAPYDLEDRTWEYRDFVAAWIISCRQSRAGSMSGFAPITRTRNRRRMNEQSSAWLSAVEGLPAIHERLKRVLVLNREALDVILQVDDPQTLFYRNPPYLKTMRSAKDVYRYEMDEQQYRDMLALLLTVRGKVILSGYPSALYDEALAGWKRHEIDIASHGAAGAEKGREVEVLWCNF